MRALVQTGYGDPERVLELQELPDEFPETNEVVIAMEAATVRVADLHTVAGRDGFRKPLPRTPGYEGVGRVAAVGEKVAHVKVGDRVLAPLGSGTHREQVRVAAESVIVAPVADPTQLALLTVNPAAAYLMLRSFVDLREGDWLIQNAANSSIGRVILQLAQVLKLRIVNVVKSSEVAAELHEEGATMILLDDHDLAGRVSTAAQGADIRLGLDAVGGEATARIARCLGEGGTLVNYGCMSGKPCELPHDLLSKRDIRVVGFNSGQRLERCSPEERKALYDRVGALLDEGVLRGRLAAAYPLERAVEAYMHAHRVGDRRVGKVVIQFGSSPPGGLTSTNG